MTVGRRQDDSDAGHTRADSGGAELAELGESIASLAARLAALETAEPAGGAADGLRRIETMLDEQRQRVETLASACRAAEDEVRRLTQELNLVARERDRLRGELERVDAMQSDTIAFDEAGDAADREPRRPTGTVHDASALPSIDELIALNAGDGPWERARPQVDPDPEPTADSTGWHELLPADMIVAQEPSAASSRKFAEEARWRLVRTDVDPPQTFALDEPLVTVGRSPSADIQIDTGYISRIHARLLRINATIILEDAGSKNGVRINGERVDRWPLKHGDALEIGAVPFRFLDLDVGD